MSKKLILVTVRCITQWPKSIYLWSYDHRRFTKNRLDQTVFAFTFVSSLYLCIFDKYELAGPDETPNIGNYEHYSQYGDCTIYLLESSRSQGLQDCNVSVWIHNNELHICTPLDYLCSTSFDGQMATKAIHILYDTGLLWPYVGCPKSAIKI